MAEPQAQNSYDSKPDEGAASEISSYARGIFESFKTARAPYEAKAEEWWNNFLSKYVPARKWREKEGDENRSRVFVKLTQLKCYTAQAKVMDALGTELPFNIEPLKTLNYGMDPQAMNAICDRRKRTLADYLKYIRFMDVLDDVVLASTIFPCGVMKGPILVREKQLTVRPRMIGGMPAMLTAPGLSPFETVEEMTDKYIFEEVPWWDYYVDPNAKRIQDSIAEGHFKRMLPQDFRQLDGLPGYHPEMMKQAINDIELLTTQSDSDNDKTRIQLADNYMGEQGEKDKRISVLELQGKFKALFIRQFNSWVPENIKDEEYVEAIVTIAGCGTVIRAQYNVFGARQFMTLRWRKVPNSVYGYGPAGLMDDSQSIVNSSARMIIDNKALSGNGLVVVNHEKINWLKTKNMKIYPRKTIYVKGTVNPKEAVDSVQFPDVTYGLKDLMTMFIGIADEETAIPKYSSGEQSQFLNKTAMGMSMLLGQVNINLKPVLKNIDDNIIEPAIERLDRVLSNFVYPPEINIPLKVTAVGTMSVMAREIIVENLLKLLQITQNPQDAIMMRRREMIREIALKLGYSEFVKTDEEIQQIEAMMAEKSKQQPMENKGRVDIDKLYPMLSRVEQAQVLASIGINPDPNYAGGPNPQTAAQMAANGGAQPPAPAPAPAPAPEEMV